MKGVLERMVRMGELAVSGSPGDVLVALGLGSCIGLALLDRRRSIVGLAHVMLPSSTKDAPGDGGFKFADRAVPALYERVVALGALPAAIEAVLVGGAKMFALSGPLLDIGARNEAATLDSLERLRVPVTAKLTAGSKGRTIRVHVDGVRVVCKEVGCPEVALLEAAA